MAKKIITYFISILALLFAGVVSFCLVLFFNPTLIITPSNLEKVLEETKFLESWKWDKARIQHKWLAWNHRGLSGYFQNFCFKYKNIESCLEEISWDFEINHTWRDGFQIKTNRPFKINSSITKLKLEKKPEETKEAYSPIPIWSYWEMIWEKKIPDFDFKFHHISIKSNEKETSFDLFLKKDQETLSGGAMDLKLSASRNEFMITGPPAYPVPGLPPTLKKIHVRNLILTGKVSPAGIPLLITGSIEAAQFNVTTFIDLPLKNDPSEILFRRALILNTKGSLSLKEIKKNLPLLAPAPYDTLPAPLNAMDGEIKINLETKKQNNPNSVLLIFKTQTHLTSDKQALIFDLMADTPFNLETNSPGKITLGIDFKKVALQLPRVSKTQAPPQFLPDSRIQNTPSRPIQQQKEEDKEDSNKRPIDVHMLAEGKNALHIKSDLLDEELRLNLNLWITDGEIKDGHIDILPLKTTVFKRPIEVSSARITYQAPLDPVIKTTINFLLPEYKIILNLEGPLSNPRHSLSSEPPLPQNDIYAVLLFGRPLADIDPDSRNTANRTNQILSQGILSLSVLYFLSGSPVEYVGYNPDSGETSAQIGLGDKTSLRVGTGQGGAGSTGIRRSLGKGWYLDNTVQDATGPGNSAAKDYGVLLERIIAY